MSEKLQEALTYFRARPVYRKLFEKLWQKAQSLGHFGGSVTLGRLDAKERETLEGFLQRSLRNQTTVTVSASTMEKALQNSRFAGLDWLEILEGYFGRDFQGAQEQRESLENRQREFFGRYTQETVAEERFAQNTFCGWLKFTMDNHSAGWQMLTKQYREDPKELALTLQALIKAAARLPVDTGTYLPLPVFAAEVTGNPHYFDEGSAAGRLFLLYLTEHFEMEKEEGCSEPEWKSRILYRAGILKDGLSNHTLFYGLHARCRDGALHPGIEGFYQMREPMQCTLQTLGGIREAWGTGEVYVVENPAVFTALINRHPEHTFVCTNGQPRLASLVLLDLLAQRSTIKYAGDFDPEGLVIAQNLKHRYGDRLEYWGYVTEYYERAMSEVHLDESRLKKLDAIQDPELEAIAQCIRRNKKAAYQESMLGFAYEVEDCLDFMGSCVM